MVGGALSALLLSVLFLGVGWSQKSPLPAPAGTVAGHVIFAETRQPARLVEVTLARRPTQDEIKADASDDETEKTSPRVVALSGRTGLDGSFVLSGVPAGEYYAIAKLGGYVLPIAPIKTEKETMDVDAVMRDIPKVKVAANETEERLHGRLRTSRPDASLHSTPIYLPRSSRSRAST